jgi:SprT-like protein
MLKGRDLYVEARRFLEKEFDMELSIPIFINPRLKKTLGYFQYHRRNGSIKIEISQEFMNYASDYEVIDVLQHELVHYALYEKGLPHSDGDKEFKDTVDRLGIGRTNTIRLRGEFHNYECDLCGSTYKRKKRISKGSYCKCSSYSTLEYKGKVVIE